MTTTLRIHASKQEATEDLCHRTRSEFCPPNCNARAAFPKHGQLRLARTAVRRAVTVAPPSRHALRQPRLHRQTCAAPSRTPSSDACCAVRQSNRQKVSTSGRLTYALEWMNVERFDVRTRTEKRAQGHRSLQHRFTSPRRGDHIPGGEGASILLFEGHRGCVNKRGGKTM